MNLSSLLTHARCGACCGPIAAPVNLMELDLQAEWEYPVAGNILTGESGKAVALVCERCLKDNRRPLEAVEFRGDEVVTHALHDLRPWQPGPRRLRWFADSPDEGPDCLCSWCGRAIEAPAYPDECDVDNADWPAVRMWHKNFAKLEARLHPRCLEQAIGAGALTLEGRDA